MEPGRALSNVEIDAHFRGEKHYGGCLAKDQLKGKKPGGKFWVINLQDQNGGDRRGSHWVCIIDCAIPDRNRDMCIYYDPFGVAPHQTCREFMAKSDKLAVWCRDEHQAVSSSACGWYCIRIIEAILNSTPYEKLFDGLLKEENYAHNEKFATSLKLKK